MEDPDRIINISNGLFENMQVLKVETIISTQKDHIKMFITGVLSAVTALTLNQWVAVFTIIYSLLQIGLLIPKYMTLVKIWREKKRAANNNGN